MNLNELLDFCLISQYKNSTNFQNLLKSLSVEFDYQLQTLEDIKYGRYLDNAIGYQLDRIGDLVGQKRVNETDEEYRVLIKARISANFTNCRINELYELFKFFLTDDDIKIQIERFYLEYHCFFNRLLTIAEAKGLKIMPTPAGVKVKYFNYTENYFGFEGNPDSLGFDLGLFVGEIV